MQDIANAILCVFPDIHCTPWDWYLVDPTKCLDHLLRKLSGSYPILIGLLLLSANAEELLIIFKPRWVAGFYQFSVESYMPIRIEFAACVYLKTALNIIHCNRQKIIGWFGKQLDCVTGTQYHLLRIHFQVEMHVRLRIVSERKDDEIF